MNSGGLILLLGAIGVAVYLANQTVTVAGTSTAPITATAPLAINCPGDPGCPGTVNYGPTDAQLGITSTGTSGLGALAFRFRGPGGWAA
jgi:hypothetical protein